VLDGIDALAAAASLRHACAHGARHQVDRNGGWRKFLHADADSAASNSIEGFRVQKRRIVVDLKEGEGTIVEDSGGKTFARDRPYQH